MDVESWSSVHYVPLAYRTESYRDSVKLWKSCKILWKIILKAMVSIS